MNTGNCFLFYIIAYLVYLSNKNFHNDLVYLSNKNFHNDVLFLLVNRKT